MLFLVTGCSSGLGLSLCRAILEAGHHCITSSRNPSKTPDAVADIEKLGGKWITLDVASSDLETDFQDILEEYGPIDVLINNAGFVSGGVFEAYTLDNARAQMETNFFGPLRLMKAIIPSMRERKSGVIVNISSSAFWRAFPVIGVYAASKFALEGLSESLAMELSPFGIRMLLVEPGGMRTSFVDNADVPEIPDAYKGTIAEYVLNAMVSMESFRQDVEKTAKAIVQEVLKPRADPALLRMPLGKESMGTMRARIEEYKQTADAREEVALTCELVD
jgi:NAD(P)-dependent dehydrogenase (short-subunit alcohol dehydrogenase family)